MYLHSAQPIVLELQAAVEAGCTARLWASLVQVKELRPRLALFSVLDASLVLTDHVMWRRAGAAQLRDEILIAWFEHLSQLRYPAEVPWLGSSFGPFLGNVRAISTWLAQTKLQDASWQDVRVATMLVSRGLRFPETIVGVDLDDLFVSTCLGAKQRQDVRRLVTSVRVQVLAQRRRSPKGGRSSSPAFPVPDSEWF